MNKVVKKSYSALTRQVWSWRKSTALFIANASAREAENISVICLNKVVPMNRERHHVCLQQTFIHTPSSQLISFARPGNERWGIWWDKNNIKRRKVKRSNGKKWTKRGFIRGWRSWGWGEAPGLMNEAPLVDLRGRTQELGFKRKSQWALVVRPWAPSGSRHQRRVISRKNDKNHALHVLSLVFFLRGQ